MCTVSMVGDYFRDNLPEKHPWTQPYVYPYTPDPNFTPTIPFNGTISTSPTREEFEALKKEVLELKELLKAAKKFDEATDQPHCENEDKVAIIKKIAELVGVDLKDVLQ